MKKFTILLLSVVFVAFTAQAQLNKRVAGPEKQAPTGVATFIPSQPVNYTVNNVDEGFEDFDDFTLNFSPWTTVDVDGSATYGFSEIEFPNAYAPMAFIVFNPSQTTPPMTDDDAIQPHTGDKFAACFASVTPPNNDWLITPLTPLGDNSSISFFAKSYTAQYGLERFKVGVSTTDTDPASFTIISGANYLTAPADAWQEFTFDLSDYDNQNIYVGIQCVSNDAFVFMVDDVVIDTEGGGVLYIYNDDFESYEVNDYIAESNPEFWTTWSNAPGTNEDALILTEQASSPVNSVKVDGVSDLVLKLGNKTSGKYQINFNLYVPTGFAGYYNIQHFEAPGVEWAYEVYFTATGDGYMNAGGANAALFTYNQNEWFPIENIIDLEEDWAQVFINGVLIHEWQFSLQAQGEPGTKQLGGVNFYAGAPTGETPKYYFDDVEYIILEMGSLEPKIEINTAPIIATIEEGETTTREKVLANVGESALEFGVVNTYDEPTVALKTKLQPSLSSGRGNETLQLDPNAKPATSNPSNRDEVILNYDGDNGSAIGLTGAAAWRVAARFPASMVEQYNGMYLTSVDVYINDPADAHKLQIYGMGSFNVPGAGELLYEQAFTPIPAFWNTITLDEPVYIDGSDIWIGYWMDQPAGIFPAGCDEGPMIPDGRWISTGPGWGYLSETLPYNWNIRGMLTGTAGPVWLSCNPAEGVVEGGENVTLEIGIDASLLAPLQVHKGKLHVRSNDLTNEHVTISVLVTVLVGVNELGEKTYVYTYPNPATDMINLKSNTEISRVVISNTIGQVVFNSNFKAKDAEISTIGLEKGIYFVQIETLNGTTTHKIMVE
jgi:hypothetical protein